MFDIILIICFVIVEDKFQVICMFLEVGLDIDVVFESGMIYWIMECNGEVVGVVGLEYGDGVSLLCGVVVFFLLWGMGLGWQFVISVVEYVCGCGDWVVYLFFKGGKWEIFGFIQILLVVVMGDIFDVLQIQVY